MFCCLICDTQDRQARQKKMVCFLYKAIFILDEEGELEKHWAKWIREDSNPLTCQASVNK